MNGQVIKRKRTENKYIIVVSVHDYHCRVNRMVAFTWLPNEDPSITKTHVNHIDKNRANNAITNLKWVICQENQAHAHGKPIVVRDARDGTDEHYFQSIAQASRTLNVEEHGVIDQGLATGRPYIERFFFSLGQKYHHSGFIKWYVRYYMSINILL